MVGDLNQLKNSPVVWKESWPESALSSRDPERITLYLINQDLSNFFSSGWYGFIFPLPLRRRDCRQLAVHNEKVNTPLVLETTEEILEMTFGLLGRCPRAKYSHEYCGTTDSSTSFPRSVVLFSSGAEKKWEGRM